MTGAFNTDDVTLAGERAIARFAGAARTDFNAFAMFVLRDAESGAPVLQGAHHRLWVAHIAACWRAGKHAAIMAPWAHGKTVQLVIGRPSWELGRNPNLRIKVVSNADKTARDRVMEVSRLITSREYRRVFPGVRPVERDVRTKSQWTQHELRVARAGNAIDPSVSAHGVLSTGIGGRADLIMFDDVCDQRNSVDEPRLRERVILNFDRVWMSRLEPHGRALLVGTPWHQADLHHELLKRPAWCVLRQWISDDFQRIEQEVYNPPADYPIPRFEEPRRAEVEQAIESIVRLGGGPEAFQAAQSVISQGSNGHASPAAWRIP